jgi:hypothetical protein
MTNIASLHPAELDELIARLGLVDPTDSSPSDVRALAPRLRSLAGARIALLENRKPNARELLQEIGQLLSERGGAATAEVRSKFIYSRPASPDIVDELAQYDAVVTAIGD